MKKVLSLIVVAGMVALISCGPSAEEKAAKEKAIADSLAAVAKADSLAAVAKADSLAAAQAADTLAVVPEETKK